MIKNSHKIIILGSSSVGKSSIIKRLVSNEFFESNKSTTGAEFYPYNCIIDGEPIKLQIWDTAGQERFKSISKSYFRNAVGAILVFDITNSDSFDQLSQWLNDFQSLAIQNSFILLVGNKIDLEEHRQINLNLINDFINRNHLNYYETSAKTGINIKEIFEILAREVNLRKKNGIIIDPDNQKEINVSINNKKNENYCCF